MTKPYYRKFLQPSYGPLCPEVCLPKGEAFHMSKPGISRERLIAEVNSDINAEFRRTVIYPSLMDVPVKDQYITREGVVLRLRVFQPLGEGPHPVMLYLHGGGFSANNLLVSDAMLRYLARYANAVVVAIDYRKAPETPVEKGLEDCYAALEWTVANAEAYGGDLRSLTVFGDSAGATLTSGVCRLALDRKGPKIHKQILIYPLLAFAPEKRFESELIYGNGGFFLDYDSTNCEFDTFFENPENLHSPCFSPLFCDDLRDLPAACFISAGCDPLLDQGLMYAAKLEDQGVEVEYHLYEGMIHGFLNRVYKETFAAYDVMCKAIPIIK